MSIFPTGLPLATDGSTEAELAAETASELAKRTGSELYVLHVLALPIDTQDPSSFEPEVRRRDGGAHARQSRGAGWRDRVLGGKGGRVSPGVGRPDAEESGPGGRDRRWPDRDGDRFKNPIRQALIGSVSDSVVRHAHCPVIVGSWRTARLPDQHPAGHRRIGGGRPAATATAAGRGRKGRVLTFTWSTWGGEARLPPQKARGILARYQRLREDAQHLLEGRVRRDRVSRGNRHESTSEDGAYRHRDRRARGETGCRAEHGREPRARSLEGGTDGQRLGLGGEARPLPRHGRPKVSEPDAKYATPGRKSGSHRIRGRRC